MNKVKQPIAKGLFIVDIHGAIIKEDLKEGIELDLSNQGLDIRNIYLTNDRTNISEWLTPAFSSSIGTLEFNHLKDQSNFLAYGEIEFDVRNTNPTQYLFEHLTILRSYFFHLWMIKDNAIDYELGFFSYKFSGTEGATQQSIAAYNYDSKGTKDEIMFSKEELVQAAVKFKMNNIILDRPSSGSEKQYGRFTTSNYFIQYARATPDLGLKITSYCSALETLFTNDITELSHKLAERVSRFLRDNKEERIECFKTVKKAYNYRSKIVHGSSLNTSHIEELKRLTTSLDQICREVMEYCFSTPDADNIFKFDNNKYEEYFIDLTLS